MLAMMWSVVLFLRVLLLVRSQFVFFFQAEDGIRDLVRSRGLGDVYKRQVEPACRRRYHGDPREEEVHRVVPQALGRG